MTRRNRNRMYWPNLLFWPAGFAVGATFYVGLATWSLKVMAVAALGTLALFAALLVAVAMTERQTPRAKRIAALQAYVRTADEAKIDG